MIVELTGKFGRPTRKRSRRSQYDPMLDRYLEIEPGKGVAETFETEKQVKTALASARVRMYHRRKTEEGFENIVVYLATDGLTLVLGKKIAVESV